MYMFHYRCNTFFGRRADGSVRILKYRSDYVVPGFPSAEGPAPGLATEVELDLIVDPNGWASIVSTVSRAGETAETFRAALEFHG